MAEQKVLGGMEKTAEQKATDIKRLKDAMVGCLGLPSKSTEIVSILSGASPDDLNSLVSMCKAVTPRVRVVGAIASELMGK